MARLSVLKEKQRWGVSHCSGHVFSTYKVGFLVSALAGECVAPVSLRRASLPCVGNSPLLPRGRAIALSDGVLG